MRNPAGITLILLSLLITGCAHRPKLSASEAQCVRLTTQAQDLYQRQAKSPDKRTAEQVTNLITAARIDREQGDFIQCIDKATRAIKLLVLNAQLPQQDQH